MLLHPLYPYFPYWGNIFPDRAYHQISFTVSFQDTYYPTKYINMCEFRKIITRETGYVAECPFCRSLEIVYGTSVIHIGFEDWVSFNEYLTSVQQNCCVSEIKNVKNIMLSFGGNSPLQMFLTADELNGFCNLTDLADSEINARHLIGLFSEE
jgi:hypothetical protein